MSPRISGFAERLRVDWYDSFMLRKDVLDYGASRIRLYDNRNIGVLARTNLMIAGIFGSDISTVIEHVYARTDVPVTDALRAWAAHVQVTFFTGDKPIRRWNLARLLDEKPWEPPSIVKRRLSEEEWLAFQERLKENIPIMVPVRQIVAVHFEWPHDPLLRALELGSGIDPTFWFHAEGVQTRDVC